MDIVTIIIAHFSYGWTQDCVSSFLNEFPDKKLVVFNNNPLPGQTVLHTRSNLGKNSQWNMLCQKEIKFLQDVCDVIDVPKSQEPTISSLPSHGKCLDFALSYLKSYQRLMHIEPDCLVSGRDWFEEMCAIDNWGVGIGKIPDHNNYTVAMCPTLWKISEVHNFISEHNLSFDKYDNQTNTGQFVMRELRKIGRMSSLDQKIRKDFIHFENGSGRSRHHLSEINFL